jgi:hypothetical protein
LIDVTFDLPAIVTGGMTTIAGQVEMMKWRFSSWFVLRNRARRQNTNHHGQ